MGSVKAPLLIYTPNRCQELRAGESIRETITSMEIETVGTTVTNCDELVFTGHQLNVCTCRE